MQHQSAGDGGSTEVKRWIERAHIDAMAAVKQYHERELAKEKIQRDLKNAALNYYEALYPYRDEDVLDTPWEERGIQWLKRAKNETVLVPERLERANNATKVVSKPKLMEVEPERLVGAIEEMNDIAKELGLGLPVQAKKPVYHAGKRSPEDYNEPVKDNIQKPE
jgi:hypothetical protein